MGYEYDVFVSYHRKEPVVGWVRGHFVPRLEEWLSQELGEGAQIFVDEDGIDTGDAWSQRLQQALLCSRVLVPVFSPTYFRRAWCTSELNNMRDREALLGYRTQANPAGLICPVRFHDGDSFPPEAKAIQCCDMRPWNINAPSFRDTTEYPAFIRAMQEFAAEVAARIEAAPAWDPAWPMVEHPVETAPRMRLPRL